MNGLLRSIAYAMAQRRGLALALVRHVVALGITVSPFDRPAFFEDGPLADWPSHPVHVDAIPDLGENQQVVFAAYPGAAPADVEAQLTYPLTTELQGLAGVRTVRSISAFGFATLYIIFDEGTPFYDARTRILEKLASLPSGRLPDGVTPRLGPDATGLGQIFWYALQPQVRSEDGTDRVVYDAYDLHELRTLQDDVVRPALAAVPGVAEVSSIGGYTLEWVVEVQLEQAANLGISLSQVATALRATHRDIGAGTLSMGGAEYILRGTGRVTDPDAIEQTVVDPARRLVIGDIARVRQRPAPRRGLLDIDGHDAVGGVVVMRQGENPREVIAGVRARIAELEQSFAVRMTRSVDGGGDSLDDHQQVHLHITPVYDRTELIDDTVATLSGALEEQVVLSTIVLLLMLGTLRGALVAAVIPPWGMLVSFGLMAAFGIEANAMSLAGIAIAIGSMIDIGIVFVESASGYDGANAPSEEVVAKRHSDPTSSALRALVHVAPATLTSVLTTAVGFLPIFALSEGAGRLFRPLVFTKTAALFGALAVAMVVVPATAFALRSRTGAPRPPRPLTVRLLLCAPLAGLLLWIHRDGPSTIAWWGGAAVILLVLLMALRHQYGRLLPWVLRHRRILSVVPLTLLALAAWAVTTLRPGGKVGFDEGTFLFMPSTAPHAGPDAVVRLLRETDAAIAAIPEVSRVVGKAGRVDSALDPAPLSMFETMVFYHPEFSVVDGERVRMWRDHIQSPADIWAEISAAAARPGLSAAPPLQPIETRQLMLQSGMRAPMGVRLSGPDTEALRQGSLSVAAYLESRTDLLPRSVQSEQSALVPTLEVRPRREALVTYGLRAEDVLQTVATAQRGLVIDNIFEGRSRIPLRLAGQVSNDIESLRNLPIGDGDLRLHQVADIAFVPGPATIRAEDSFETRYVFFSPGPDVEDVGALAEEITEALDAIELPFGVRAKVTGTFEQEAETASELRILVPASVLLVLLLIYLQFRNLPSALTVMGAATVSLAGAMASLGVLHLLGITDGTLSPGVWVDFVALIGIAVDDGVLMMTFLQSAGLQSIGTSTSTDSLPDLHDQVVRAASRRVAACVMTTATTLLALMPVLAASGRGSDLMVPMAYPLFFGMGFELLTLFIVPALHCAALERQSRKN